MIPIIAVLNSVSATGTIVGTLGNLVNVVSPEDYGGSLADAVATGQHVYIPANKTYTIAGTNGGGIPGQSAAIKLATGQRIIGADVHTSKIVITGNGRGIHLSAKSGVFNITMEGAGKTAGHANNVGIFTNDIDFTISGCIFTGFSGTDNAGGGGGAIQCYGNMAVSYLRGGTISDCLFENNVTGMNIMERAEFLNITNNRYFSNTTGFVSYSGNNRISNCNFIYNTLAYSMQPGANNGHGSMTNCTVNHNGTNLKIASQSLGFAFTGCHFYDGHIEITDSTDITFGNCHLPGGGGNNMILTNNTANGVRIDALSKYIPTGYTRTVTGPDLVIV